MAEREVEVLKRARENFVRKRREMAEQMIPSGAAAQHFAPSFVALQATIEAIDRAIKDEENSPEGYASGEPIWKALCLSPLGKQVKASWGGHLLL